MPALETEKILGLKATLDLLRVTVLHSAEVFAEALVRCGFSLECLFAFCPIKNRSCY